MNRVLRLTWPWPGMFLILLAVGFGAWSCSRADDDAASAADTVAVAANEAVPATDAATPVANEAVPAEDEAMALFVPAPPPSVFTYELPKAGLTSAGVFDERGLLVRTLWRMETKDAGKHNGMWDGMTDLKQPAGVGTYEVRVVLNNGVYQNVAVIGNTGSPPNDHGHIQGNAPDMCVDAAGRIYTANGWDEAGHDFKVFNPDGTTAFHARYQIRHGTPSGGPYAIVVDDGFIYCAVEGWINNKTGENKQVLQRYTIENGDHVPFTDESLKASAGNIVLYEAPRPLIPADTEPADAERLKTPLKALAIRGDELLCADMLGDKIRRFHKVTGEKLGEFEVKRPHAMAVDRFGNIWVGHEHSKVSVFSIEGERLDTPIDDAKFIGSLKFGGPDNQQLILADSGAGQVRIYKDEIIIGRGSNPATYTSPILFGDKAKPGDFSPDRFYSLQCAVMDAEGNLITSQTMLPGGFRLTTFAPDRKTVLWDHMGLEFCTTGNYAKHRPDELISQMMHRIALDRENFTWTYKGTVLASDPKYVNYRTGPSRFVKIGENEFFFQSYGDGMQVYRRDNDGLLWLASMVGGVNPMPDGTWNDKLPKDQRKRPGLWTWSDASGDGVVDADEVTMFKEFGQAKFVTFGMNVDPHGHLLYCEHHTKAIHELPRSGVDERGNPTYDWTGDRILVPADEGPAKFLPLMAVRAEDGSVYALGRAEEGSVFERALAGNDGAVWMGGELLARYNKDGKRLWIIRMPKKCNGLDVIPGGGVATGHYESGEVYHVIPDGLIIGSVKPGAPAGNITGWLDNTAAISVNRGPDGVIDLFVEDSYLHRFLWHRVDDKNIQTIKAAEITYSSCSECGQLRSVAKPIGSE